MRSLVQKIPLLEIPGITGLSDTIVKQYIALIRQYDSALVFFSESEQALVSSDDIPVPAPARTTARSAGRVKGDRRESERSEAPLDAGEHLATVEQVLEQVAC